MGFRENWRRTRCFKTTYGITSERWLFCATMIYAIEAGNLGSSFGWFHLFTGFVVPDLWIFTSRIPRKITSASPQSYKINISAWLFNWIHQNESMIQNLSNDLIAIKCIIIHFEHLQLICTNNCLNLSVNLHKKMFGWTHFTGWDYNSWNELYNLTVV